MSDTHGAELPSTFPPCDVLLHCGDTTEDGLPSSISQALHSLGRIPAELKLIIAGNHEISLDKEYCISVGGSAEMVAQSRALVSNDPASEASINRITFLEEGTHTFTLASGATFTIYASPYTSVYGCSGFKYPSKQDRFNPPATTPSWGTNTGTESSRIPDGVDIIMTHGPAKYILDATTEGDSIGCEHLRRAVERVRPKLFCFGHVHAGYGAQRLEFDAKKVGGDATEDSIVEVPKEWVGKVQARKKGYASLPPGSVERFREGGQTLAVNASMEGEKGVVENVPWLVELDL